MSVVSGTVQNFDLGPRKREEAFAFRYTGFIEVPRDAVYQFTVVSDDGAKLYVAGQLVVDNDGIHPAKAAVGSIGLRAGKHAITLLFFDAGSHEYLAVSYQGPGIPRQVIPDRVLLRTE